MVAGMIRKGSCHMADIGSGLPQDIDANSREVAAKRFVDNKWVDHETHYLPFVGQFLRALLCLLPGPLEILLVIDGSQMGKNHAALMVCLAWRGRGIPLCWFVKKGAKGHFTQADHTDLIGRAQRLLLPLLPEGAAVTLLGDGEFDGVGLQKSCLGYGWDYALRTACDTVLHEGGERFQPKAVAPAPGERCLFIPGVEFTTARFRYVNFVCWHDQKKHKEPIYLVSNLEDAWDIIGRYDERFSIECLFKDLKSTSFNLHQTRLESAFAISNLIMIGSLAFIVLLCIGLEFEHSPLRKKVQRLRKDRQVLSIFAFAYKLVAYLLDKDIGFSFSFQFSKNSSPFLQRDD
jgi:Transposase DDE domain